MKNQRGYTAIELLIVLGAALAGIASLALVGALVKMVAHVTA